MKKINKKDFGLLNPDYKIITQLEPNSPISEAYRRIKVSLDFSSIDETIKVIQICSSVKGEGKTTTVLNIAATYAENKKKVIVVDLDLRKPRCHRAFQIENKNGVTDVLLGEVELKDAIKHDEKIGFDLLNSGRKASNISYVIESKQLKEIIKELKNTYDVVLVDCPPVLAVSDPIIISSFCDVTIFVVSQIKSERRIAKEAVKTLKANNVNLIGCVFTEINAKHKVSKNSNYYYNYYYGNTPNDKRK